MNAPESQGGEAPLPWHLGIYDAHCHPTDTMSSIQLMPSMNARAFAIMATRPEDQELVEHVASAHQISSLRPSDAHGSSPDTDGFIIPSFGWHPWFSHKLFDDQHGALPPESEATRKFAHYQAVLTPPPDDHDFLSDLSDPMPLSKFIAQTRTRLEKHPNALVGEIGLDKSFRIPSSWLTGQKEARNHSLTPGGREGRNLSPYRVHLSHQTKVLRAQLELAGELQRAVSVHGVQAHGYMFDTLQSMWRGHERQVVSNRQRRQAHHVVIAGEGHEKPNDQAPSAKFPPRLCLHSYSGPPDFVSQYVRTQVPIDVYFSFSLVINFSTPASIKTEAVIKAVPPDRLLVESDMHTAGADMDANLEAIVRKVCSLREWTHTQGIEQLGRNWNRFVFGRTHSA
ncbi:MAG: hypothetical protein M1828_002028 [Chrysothrix sp. TS-e1954]|nr:MAG: hypothetical protein M1828_002028 [Chrysothrix sp. TS-e1954]